MERASPDRPARHAEAGQPDRPRPEAHGARTRQMQYIGKLMRQLETTVLSRVRAALTPGRADGQGLEPDYGGGHVASSSSQRNR